MSSFWLWWIMLPWLLTPTLGWTWALIFLRYSNPSGTAGPTGRWRLHGVDTHWWTFESPATSVNIVSFRCTFVSFPVPVKSWDIWSFQPRSPALTPAALGQRTLSWSASIGWVGMGVAEGVAAFHEDSHLGMFLPNKMGEMNKMPWWAQLYDVILSQWVHPLYVLPGRETRAQGQGSEGLGNKPRNSNKGR